MVSYVRGIIQNRPRATAVAERLVMALPVLLGVLMVIAWVSKDHYSRGSFLPATKIIALISLAVIISAFARLGSIVLLTAKTT